MPIHQLQLRAKNSPKKANTSVTDAVFWLLCVTVDEFRGFPFNKKGQTTTVRFNSQMQNSQRY